MSWGAFRPMFMTETASTELKSCRMTTECSNGTKESFRYLNLLPRDLHSVMPPVQGDLISSLHRRDDFEGACCLCLKPQTLCLHAYGSPSDASLHDQSIVFYDFDSS